MLHFFQTLFAPPRDLILIVAAVWAGLTLVEKRAGRSEAETETVNTLIFAALLGYLLGGRIFYAAEHMTAMLQDPWAVISLNLNLFDPSGALASCGIAGFAYGRRSGLPFWPTMDAVTPLLASVAVGIGFSHLASGAAFGMPADLPWVWQLWGASRHPSQAYEILASLLTLGLVWIRKAEVPGTDFLFFVAVSAGWRLFLEAYRGDSRLVLGGLRLAQVAAWIVLAAAILGLEYLQKQRAARNT